MKFKWTTTVCITALLTACGGSSDDNTATELESTTETDSVTEFASHTCEESGLIMELFTPTSSGECINGEPPAPVGTVAFDAASIVSPSHHLIQGGSQSIQIFAETPYFEIYVSEPGRYIKYTKAGNSNGDQFFVGFEPTVAEDVTKTVKVQIGTAEGAISEPVLVSFDEVEVGTGELQFSLSWSDASYDLDLQVQAPDGTFINKATPTGTAGGTLDLTSNNDCVIDNVNDENIFFEPGAAQRGAYQLTVTNSGKCGSTANQVFWVITARSPDGVERFMSTLATEGKTNGAGFIY